jgi:uncharacterized membrane protein YoaK (UPF0700 family)
MINRLPGWVWLGGGLLAAIAGMVNAVGLLGISHQGLTHMSGAATSLGVQLSGGHFADALGLVALLVAFVAGAVVSSVLVRDDHLQLGRRYGVALLAESLLLTVSVMLLVRGIAGGTLFIAAAAGLQNAMASTFSGAVVRTTHVTGIFTDIGIVIGQALRGAPMEKRKLTLLCTIGGGFVLGSGVGAWWFGRVGYHALWIPVALTALGGAAYIVYSHWTRGRRQPATQKSGPRPDRHA